MSGLPFPDIDPVAIAIGPLEIRWYGIAYVAGILLAWLYCRHLLTRASHQIERKDVDDFIMWAALGIVLGGRLGWVMFYMPSGYFDHFWEVLYLWRPGMSFHGGLVGVVGVTIYYCWQRNLWTLAFSDLLASSAPIGLFFGRLANFINGELYGRVTDVSWGVVFPGGGPEPRHPSQLYEAALEGVFLFFFIMGLEHFTNVRKTRPGFMFGIFLVGYALARSIVEMFRQPDDNIGFLFLGSTMGQLLSLPILLVGLIILGYASKNKILETNE